MQVDALDAGGAGDTEWENLAAILEEHERAALRGQRLVLELLASYDVCGGRGVDERILEESEHELLGHDACDRLVESRFSERARANSGNELRRLLGSAELVDAGVDRFGETVGLRERLHAPRHRDIAKARALATRRAIAAAGAAVVGDGPVREDDAAKMVSLAQVVGQQLPAIARADRFNRHTA